MHLDAATLLADSLIGQWPDLDGWRLQINPRFTRKLGLCDYRQKVIYLGQSFVLLNEEPLVVQGVKHEIAHALVGPGYGHGVVWRFQAKALGIPPVRCGLAVNMPLGKLIAACPGCGSVFSLYRKPRRPDARRWCLRCGPENGQLTFTPNPALVTS